MIALSAAFATTGARAGSAPLVFAAASLKTVLDEVAPSIPMRLNYAGSGVLARQITLGAPADIFISANAEWMKVVADAGLLSWPPVDLLTNSLVVIGSTPEPDFSISDLASGGRVAMGLTEAVPAGQYAKAALSSLGLWDQVRLNAVQSENVRAAMAFVARGEIPRGIVYKTDALADKMVHILTEISPDLHPPISYQAGLIAPTAAETLDRLISPEAKTIFQRHGFGVL